ncbi:MAG: S8 family peptidase [Bacillota bacterium]
MRRLMVLVLLFLLIGSAVPLSAANSDRQQIDINVALNTAITEGILADLSTYGTIRETIPQINAVLMKAPAGKLTSIQALPYVKGAGPDAERMGSPVDLVEVTDFAAGLNTWDLDAINVTDFGVTGRQVAYDGTDVYVAVLDTGLQDSWRKLFPEERIAVEYAKAFTGGPVGPAAVAEPENQWEHDQNGHGTHVTSTILGYNFYGHSVNGVSPKVTIIPVKVLGNAGWGTSGMVAKGIVYVADLKKGPLAAHPVVINMSLGGSVLDEVEKAAIDYAIGAGVVIVAAAGNAAEAGMGYPGAYAPVISVAAAGWVGEWQLRYPDGRLNRMWTFLEDVPDPTDAEDYYITDFSSRELEGQDLDVAAPGSWVLGPYQWDSGNKLTYYYLGGTSMASPHVAGIVALMLQKNPGLSASEVETILEGAATPLPSDTKTVYDPYYGTEMDFTWGDDAAGAGLITADAALNATPAAP